MEATETTCIAEIIHREISPDDRYLLRKSQKDYVFFFIKYTKKGLHCFKFLCRIISIKSLREKSQIVLQRMREAENA